MSRWSSGWSRAVTNNAVPRSFLHLEVVSTLLQRLNLLALGLTGCVRNRPMLSPPLPRGPEQTPPDQFLSFVDLEIGVDVAQ